MQAHSGGAQLQSAAGLAARWDRLVAAALAALLGLVVIWGVGFAQIPTWHNAAHDTRHSMAFPCH